VKVHKLEGIRTNLQNLSTRERGENLLDHTANTNKNKNNANQITSNSPPQKMKNMKEKGMISLHRNHPKAIMIGSIPTPEALNTLQNKQESTLEETRVKAEIKKPKSTMTVQAEKEKRVQDTKRSPASAQEKKEETTIHLHLPLRRAMGIAIGEMKEKPTKRAKNTIIEMNEAIALTKKEITTNE
jgi:hypothetical protein